jgi:hypothetical protein
MFAWLTSRWLYDIIVSLKGQWLLPTGWSVLDQLITDRGKAWDGIDGEGARKREGISGGGKSLDKI